jgi:hypothetical protein
MCPMKLREVEMILVVRLGTPQSPGPVMFENTGFTEPFLPSVGDIVTPHTGRGPNGLVTSRLFLFNAGAPNVQGVELDAGRYAGA